jgi:hypothetical protein
MALRENGSADMFWLRVDNTASSRYLNNFARLEIAVYAIEFQEEEIKLAVAER